jgi:4-hydroxy 2-oxovalerate aldolase
MKIIDCTIRDGGHLNNWDFDHNAVKAAYYAALKSGIDFFEIGYRFPYSHPGLGDYGYCKDDFLFSLVEANEKCKLLVMVNANTSDKVEFTDCDPKLTPISGVRVAAYPYEYERAFKLIELLHSKGYLVYMNLMASSEITEEQYQQLKNWENKHLIGSIYFADSFGGFTPSDIPFFVNKLKEIGFNEVGFHSHNNLQMAFANSLKSIELGATFIDASIYGMGRGAGNLPIEILLGYLEKEGYKQYNTLPYLEVIERYFYPIFKKIEWGYSTQALIGGLANIHPYYVDNLFERNTYTIEEIWNAANIIKEKCPTSFSLKELNKVMGERFYTPLTEENVQDIIEKVSEEFKIIAAHDTFKVSDFKFKNAHKGRKLLIIANGPSLLTHKKFIQEFIEKENPVTIGVNFLQDTIVPDYHLFISRKRLQKYASNINPKSKVILPSFFGKEFVTETGIEECTYFDMEIVDKANNTIVEGTTQQCVYPNVSISAMVLAHLMGASEIYAVGLDGYIDELNKKMVYFYNENDTPDDKEIASIRYEMFSKELERTNNFLQNKSVPFFIITPTSHKKYYKNLFQVPQSQP